MAYFVVFPVDGKISFEYTGAAGCCKAKWDLHRPGGSFQGQLTHRLVAGGGFLYLRGFKADQRILVRIEPFLLFAKIPVAEINPRAYGGCVNAGGNSAAR